MAETHVINLAICLLLQVFALGLSNGMFAFLHSVSLRQYISLSEIIVLHMSISSCLGGKLRKTLHMLISIVTKRIDSHT